VIFLHGIRALGLVHLYFASLCDLNRSEKWPATDPAHLLLATTESLTERIILLWKFKMMAILSSYELWDTATGIDKQPEATVDASGSILPPSPTAVQEWRQRNADALCAIVISVQDSVLTMVQHVTKASEAWELLRNQYETTNPTRVMNLENQLQSKRLAEGEAVDVFLT